MLPFISEKESNVVEAVWEDQAAEIDAAREKLLGKQATETLAGLRSLGAIDYNIAQRKVIILEDAKSQFGVYAKAGSKLRPTQLHFI